MKLQGVLSMRNSRRMILGAALAVCSTAIVAPASAQTCGDTTWTLWAGQYKDVGSVTVSNDLDNLYITYTLDYQDPECLDDLGNPTPEVEAEFGTLHLWVGDDLLNVPAVPNGPNAGTPIPGQFPYSFDATGLQTYTFTVPFDELGITGANDACGTLLYVVAHAEVNYLDCDGNLTGGGDTGFGGDNPVNVGDPGRWWYYGEYIVCCDFGPPPTPFCQTAYAKGGYVWTTMKRANPENLPSLELTKSRWGWAINVTELGETQYQIWAGAGLNDTSKGVLVGTLTVVWDGTEVCFLYDLDAGFTMEELHVYAGDTSPTTIAPGQYGYIQDFNDDPVEDWSDCVPVEDTDEDGVWVVAHAVVCFE
jgi:hypothetical protein